MARFSFYLLSAVLCSLTVLGQGDVTTEETVTITVPETTVISESTESTITEDNSKKTTTSTPKPTTTSTAPTTTSMAPTTTTGAPTTPPAPQPTPGPLPPPQKGSWSYTENNVTCIVVQFAAQLNVTYTKAVNSSTSLAYVLLNVPVNATVSGGSCNGTDQWVTLSWPANSTASNNMTLAYHRNDTTKRYELKSLNVSLTPSTFPNGSSQAAVVLSHGSEWQTPLATSYRCASPSQLNMTAETTSVVGILTLSQLQEEAFRTASGKGFSAARDCGGGDVPDAVPIAVGCALGGLVVVVLVAYLVGRRRSAARGYLSM